MTVVTTSDTVVDKTVCYLLADVVSKHRGKVKKHKLFKGRIDIVCRLDAQLYTSNLTVDYLTVVRVLWCVMVVAVPASAAADHKAVHLIGVVIQLAYGGYALLGKKASCLVLVAHQ